MNDFSAGLPVEIGEIEKALGRLWENSAETKTRASLLNLVIYCENLEQARTNTSLLAEIAGRHACRAILILSHPNRPPSAPKAWIAAHCRKVGSRELCSEQITFELSGEPLDALPGIVFPHLDSDLPLALWWQAPLPAQFPNAILSAVDRLMFDSSTWPSPSVEIPKIRKLLAKESLTVLADLNWTRVLWARFAIAGLFDHSVAHDHLPRLESLQFTHAPEYKMAALLLLGWIASRLGWSPSETRLQFRRADGYPIGCSLIAEGTAPISQCAFRCGSLEFDITLRGRAFHATIKGADCDASPRAFGVPSESLADLLVAELSRGGTHGNYRHSLQILFHWL